MENNRREECQLLLPPISSSMTPEIDLSLSMSIRHSQLPCPNNGNNDEVQRNMKGIEARRLVAAEREYADRVRDRARRERKFAEKEFARARMIWERAREDMEKVEGLKMAATKRVGSTCIEITCQACRQRFQPYEFT